MPDHTDDSLDAVPADLSGDAETLDDISEDVSDDIEIVEYTREDCTYVGYAVEKTDPSFDAERSVVTAFRVPRGEAESRDVTDEYSG
ncbi:MULTISPECIES: hypothetical protein [Haloarcula]|uniref:hypothetical protein n=1 Tax=Haloarcula TaxID=2237 RepID=UPI0023EB4E09|nr:hypothetical protein [Halomicroarcula sp. XH51]